MNSKIQLFGKEYLLFILCILVTLFNTALMQQDTVLILSVPQYLLVFYYLFNKDYHTAFLLHSAFIVACVSRGTVIEGGQSDFFYINFMVYRALTLNIVILVWLWIGVYNMPIKISKDSMIVKSKMVISYLLVSGSLIGVIGFLLFEHYNLTYFVNCFLFVLETYLFIDIFIHLYSNSYSKRFAILAVCMMAAAPIAAFVSFVLGINAYYNDEPMPLCNPIIGLTPCLIIAFFQLNNNKLKIISVIGLAFYVLQMMILSRGSQFLDIFIVLVLLAYLVYFKKGANFQLKSLKLLLPLIIVVSLPFAISEITAASETSFSKFEQFTSLFSIFNFSGGKASFDFSDVGRSPLIRIGELANIIHEGSQNIFTFIFGKGFGGYYVDSLGFFAHIDLSHGAFPYEIVAKGRFYSAHSAVPSVLHYNGWLGLFLMVKIALNYLRKVDCSFLVFAAFVLFVQSFYFDMFGCFSYIIALFGAEYLINDTTKKAVL